jgi:fucose permease
MGVLTVLAVKVPYPAGLFLAAAITAVGCVIFAAVQNVVRSDTIEWGVVLGGVFVAAVLGTIGLLMVLAGAPAFE